MAGKNKVVLSGYYGFDNIGDEAVLYSIVSLLKQEIEDIDITVLSNNPEKTSAVYGVKSVNRWDLKSVIKTIKASDMLISGGGSLLQDVTSSKTIPYYLAIVKIAQFFKKRVVFYSQGIGPVNKPFNRFLIKKVVNKVDSIFVREPASKRLLEEIGIKKPISVAIDPVIGIKHESKAAIVPEHSVGIYIRPWENEKEIIESLVPSLVMLVKKQYKLYFIPMHYEQDLEVAKKLKDKLLDEIEKEKLEQDVKKQIIVIDKMLSIQEVLHYTQGFEFIIGMRLHSLIMAAAEKIPMLALSYDPKVTAFMKEIKVPYCIKTEEISGEIVAPMLEELISHTEEQKKHLAKMYEEKKERVYMPVKCIKSILKHSSEAYRRKSC